MSHDKHTIELSIQSIRTQVDFSLTAIRAGHFNRQASIEHHCAVVRARFEVLASLAYAEISRLEKAELGSTIEAGVELYNELPVIRDEMLENLRDRRLLKYLFMEDPEDAMPFGGVDRPLDAETQIEIVDTLAKIVLKHVVSAQ
jgi:hypothetical protein